MQMKWRGWPENTPIPICYHAEFRRSSLKGVDINTGEPPKWGALKLRSLGMGGVADPKTHAQSLCVTTSNLRQVCHIRKSAWRKPAWSRSTAQTLWLCCMGVCLCYCSCMRQGSKTLSVHDTPYMIYTPLHANLAAVRSVSLQKTDLRV